MTVTAATTYGPHQLADRIGLSHNEIDRARELGIIAPDVDGRWSQTLADELAGQVDQIRARIADERALGVNRCAALLAELTGLPVQAEDIRVFVDDGTLTATDEYKGHPMYPVSRIRELADHPGLPAMVTGRQEWLAVSLDLYEAADRLGWRVSELVGDAAACGVQPGRFGRFAVADLDRLAADSDFAARRLLGPDQSAARLDVRRVDFDYVVAAGWVTVAKYVDVPVGRRSTVRVALYRAGDIDAILDVPGVDWHEVRTVRRGQPSPLREFARRPASRAQVIRRIAADLGNRFRREVWAFYNGHQWEIDWEIVDGIPTREQVTAVLADDPGFKQFGTRIRLSTGAGAAVNWARAMLTPGAAVILDTETNGLFGRILEVAVIDACTGKVLLDTLVNPGERIDPDSTLIHGITDDDVADAPPWSEVVPKLLKVTRGRQILAYNADYDAEVIRADTQDVLDQLRADAAAAAGLRPEHPDDAKAIERAGRKAATRAGVRLAHLAEPDRWGCIMLARTDWTRAGRWLPLGGGHRALGDTQEARRRLLEMTAPAAPRGRR